MKIIFVTHNYLPDIDATIRIIKNISKYLSDCGADVSILTYCLDKNSVSEEIIDNQRIYRVKINIFARLVKRILRVFQKERIYRHPAIEKKVAYLNRKEKFDFIIPVVHSSTNAVSVLYASKKNPEIKFIPYFVDPFSAHPCDLFDKKLKIRLEREIYKKCSRAFVTHEMYQENSRNFFKEYTSKMVSLHFPNIRKLNKFPVSDDIHFNKNYINCTYTGQLYPDIRNTKFIFSLFKSCKNTNIVFHIVGGANGYDPDLEEAVQILKERLIIHGKVSGQAAINAILDSDILINIGNNVTNMLPSKIFEYFSTGKPIVNTYKNLDCPSLKYTKKYPICLDLSEEQAITGRLIEQFENFCAENKEKNIPYEEVEAIYTEHTIKSVGMKFLQVLNEAKGENIENTDFM